MVNSEEIMGIDPGLVIFDFNQNSREMVIMLGGKIVIDSRDKLGRPGYPHGYTDREELEKYNRVIKAIAQVVISGIYNEDDWSEVKKLSQLAVVKTMQDIGFTDAREARIKGTVPKNWDPTADIIQRHFGLLRGERWREKKHQLLEFEKSLQTASRGK